MYVWGGYCTLAMEMVYHGSFLQPKLWGNVTKEVQQNLSEWARPDCSTAFILQAVLFPDLLFSKLTSPCQLSGNWIIRYTLFTLLHGWQRWKEVSDNKRYPFTVTLKATYLLLIRIPPTKAGSESQKGNTYESETHSTLTNTSEMIDFVMTKAIMPKPWN